MNLSLYRSTHVVLHRRRLVAWWNDWLFSPRPESRAVSTESVIHLVGATVELHIRVPYGSEVVRTELVGRLSPVEERLRTYNEPYGYTAATVWYLCQIGARDYRVDIAVDQPILGSPDLATLPIDDRLDVDDLFGALTGSEERTRGGRRVGSPGP